MLSIRFETDEWRERLTSAMDDAEAKYGAVLDATEYDDAADQLRRHTLRRLDEAGVNYEPAYRQSVGNFVILQGGGTEAEREAFDESLRASMAAAIAAVDHIARKGAEWSKEEAALQQARDTE